MKDATRGSLVLVIFCFVACTAFSQTPTVVSPPTAVSSTPNITCRATLGPISGSALAGPPAPYSAVREFSSVQTLSDGTHITHKPTTEKIYRDSEGRERTERPFCGGPTGDPGAMVITIRDPVSGYGYILDSENQIAHRYEMQVRKAVHTAAAPRVAAQTALAANRALVPKTNANRPTSVKEDLGGQTMEGVYVEGWRTTDTIPTGAEDNDQPFTVVHEDWLSPDLNVFVLTKTSDPRIGDMTNRLTQIDRSEPSLSLFSPPSKYKIVDETAPITLTYTRH
ncbi:MAG: hypothetical protein WBC25_11810 [Candidatus Acidiferrum sp.]